MARPEQGERLEHGVPQLLPPPHLGAVHPLLLVHGQGDRRLRLHGRGRAAFGPAQAQPEGGHGRRGARLRVPVGHGQRGQRLPRPDAHRVRPVRHAGRSGPRPRRLREPGPGRPHALRQRRHQADDERRRQLRAHRRRVQRHRRLPRQVLRRTQDRRAVGHLRLLARPGDGRRQRQDRLLRQAAQRALGKGPGRSQTGVHERRGVPRRGDARPLCDLAGGGSGPRPHPPAPPGA